MKRTELKRSAPMARGGFTRKPRANLPAQSAKRKTEAVLRRGLVARLLAERPVCEGRWACRGARAVDVHERIKRSRGGSITDPDQAHMVTLCRPCHELTEAEPAEATQRRLLLPSWHRCPDIGPC